MSTTKFHFIRHSSKMAEVNKFLKHNISITRRIVRFSLWTCNEQRRFYPNTFSSFHCSATGQGSDKTYFSLYLHFGEIQIAVVSSHQKEIVEIEHRGHYRLFQLLFLIFWVYFLMVDIFSVDWIGDVEFVPFDFFDDLPILDSIVVIQIPDNLHIIG